jgi:hypothetical protein
MFTTTRLDDRLDETVPAGSCSPSTNTKHFGERGEMRASLLVRYSR